MGGKSRKAGGVSKDLINRLKKGAGGKKGKSKPKSKGGDGLGVIPKSTESS